jgi:hypothetical protein
MVGTFYCAVLELQSELTHVGTTAPDYGANQTRIRCVKPEELATRKLLISAFG